MSDPALALQGAIITTLKDTVAVTALVGERIYDDVPTAPQPTFPYISFGEGQTVGDDLEVECGDGSEVFIELHAWSRTVGFPECKQITDAVRTALRPYYPTIAGAVVSVVEYRGTRYLRDPDGLTKHAIVEFRYLITH
jgi:hypothetical protein